MKAWARVKSFIANRHIAQKITIGLTVIAGLLLCAQLITFARFVIEHERFPLGSGEVYNWAFGLGG